MASFQDRAQHSIAQLDKEVRFHCVFRWGLRSSPRYNAPVSERSSDRDRII
jgi:hypothetical protein